ncbi:MAG: DUF3866 family protein [Thermoanaerobacteraceae bacterium]|nr:DUF3866 family protein [Thermoanaerobacteraceae bacterium]
MISINSGIVKKIILKRNDITFVEVELEGEITKAVNYDHISGEIKVGDKVYINETAKKLNLGTGGYDFILLNTRYHKLDLKGNGHIMKLRYTPAQINVLSVEEQDSPYHETFNNFKSLDGIPVIIGELHSMVAPASIVLKHLKTDIKIAYIMTDSASIPISFSNTVYYLKKEGIINETITIGHAFGGDYEAVNIYTALICAKEIIKADVIIVAMGPGIVGTGTKYGFTGIDQGYYIDAVNKLGGNPILIPRISFSDKRERHMGISHHTITVLEVCNSNCTLTFPVMEKNMMEIVNKQIQNNPVFKKFNKVFIDASITNDYLKNCRIKITTMGRDYSLEKEFFNACGAAAIYCNTLF